MLTVELRPAYVWTCETCASVNFCQGMTWEGSDEDREAMFREFHELEDWQELPNNWRDFEPVYVPETVKCHHCSEEFSTRDERSDE